MTNATALKSFPTNGVCPPPCGRVFPADLVAQVIAAGKSSARCEACGNRYQVARTLNEALIPNFEAIKTRIALVRVTMRAPTWERKIPKAQQRAAGVKVVDSGGREQRAARLTAGLDAIRRDTRIARIHAAQSEFKATLHAVALRCDRLANGLHVVPFDLLGDVFAAEEKAQRVILGELEQLRDDWPRMREKARADLGALWTDNAVPTYEGLRYAYRWEPISVEDANVVIGNVDERVATIDRVRYDLMRKEATKARDLVAEDLRAGLRQTFADLLGALQTALGGIGSEGRRFAGANLENVQAFVANFAKLNVTEDAEIAKLATKISRVLAGQSADDVKQIASVQAQVADVTTQALEQLKKLKVEPKPSRRIGGEL